MTDDRLVTRRSLLCGGLAVTAGLAGCLASGSAERPNPLVVHTDPTDVSDLSGETTVEATVLVHNTGAAGEIVVTVETFAGPEEPVARTDKTVRMDGDSQTEVRLDVVVPIEGKQLVATAEAAKEQ
jgi:hypothetical protein